MRTGLFSSSKPSSPSHCDHGSSPSSSSSSSPSRAHHTFSDQMMEENIETAEAIITKRDIDASTHSNFEAKQFQRAVHDLQNAMKYLIKHDSTSESLIRAQNLMESAMGRLEKEFHSILSSYRDNTILDSDSVSNRTSVSDEEEYSESSAMENLKTIAECMISSGYGKECINIYKLVRQSIVDESLYNLGLLEKLTPHQLQKLEFDVLEVKIKNWVAGIKIAIKNIFLGERILCDYVFSSSEKTIESCFAEVTKERALAVLSFPEMVAKYKKLSAEKMFRILDLYEAISTLLPEIEAIFSFDSFSAVRSEAVTSLVKLGDAVRMMFSEFESAVEKDTSKAVPGGGIHPLTRYVMNYLVFLADYRDSLADIVVDWHLPVNSPLPVAYLSSHHSSSAVDDGEESPLSVRVAWLILVLLCKLDAKAEMYKDVPLAYLFLANNLNYVVLKVRESNLGPILGSDWIVKHEFKVKQYASNYERIGWSNVTASFPENPTVEMSPNYVKECFRRFNSSFEEVYRIQSSWVILDKKLREQVKISLAKKIVPIYRDYYENYRNVLRTEIGEEPIVKFAPDDLGNYLSDLFHGVKVSGSTTYNGSTSHSSHWSISWGR